MNSLPPLTLTTFSTQLQKLTQETRFCLALSGGVDSTVLLHLMAQLCPLNKEWQLRCIHVHHGLQAAADSFAQYCEQLCRSSSIPLLIKKVTVTKTYRGIEAAARNERYRVLAEQLKPNECLLTAQHKNDQAETLLLQLMRGTGVAGLAAMPAIKRFACGWQVRPLLRWTRAELHAYAEQESLVWIEDPSNQDSHLARPTIRHAILPQLLEKWPGGVATLARSAENLAEAAQLLNELAQLDLPKLQRDSGLDIHSLRQLSPQRQRNVLRYWITQSGYLVPNKNKLLAINRIIATECGSALVDWSGAQLRRYRDQLYLMAPPLPNENKPLRWNGMTRLPLPTLLGVLSPADYQQLAIPAGTEVTIRFRRGGERCRPENRQGSCSLKKLLQELAVPPWLRTQQPLIYCNDHLIALVVIAPEGNRIYRMSPSLPSKACKK